MIIPPKKKSNKPVYVSASVTLIVVLITFAILIFTDMREIRSQRELYREIDYVRIIELLPERTPETRQPEPREEMVEEEVVEPDPAPPRQRVDLREVMPDGLRVDMEAPQRPITERPTDDIADARARRSLRIEQEELGDVGGFETLRDMAFDLPDGLDAGNGGLDRGGLALEGRPGTETGGLAGDFRDGGGVLGGPQAREEDTGTSVEIGLRDIEEFGEDYDDFAPIYRALAEWMRQNPANLPVSVRRLMAEDRWDPEFLTSRVQFEAQGRIFDMLLMLKEEIYEVHIVLVERSEATYLIDRNFQRESNSLRVGGVDVRDGEIASIQSQMQAAGDQRTREFYQIFLSWWDEVSEEMEEP